MDAPTIHFSILQYTQTKRASVVAWVAFPQSREDESGESTRHSVGLHVVSQVWRMARGVRVVPTVIHICQSQQAKHSHSSNNNRNKNSNTTSKFHRTSVKQTEIAGGDAWIRHPATPRDTSW